jgi:hypothetical protein
MRFLARFLVAVALITVCLAQTPWAKKDWKEWSSEDCKKVLENSPWAQSWKQGSAKMASFSASGGVASEGETEVTYVVQFRSALPIRQAVVRQALIASKYDKLGEEKKAAMLKQAEGFLGRSYDDVIVVHVTYESNVPEYNRQLSTFWQSYYPEGTVPQEAFLNGPKGQKISPLRLMAPKGGLQEFELFFPRVVDGKPLLEPGDKTISVEFVAPHVGSVTSTRLFQEFRVDKMELNGKIIY